MHPLPRPTRPLGGRCHRRQGLRWLLGGAAFICTPIMSLATAQANPPADVRSRLPQARLVGSGQLRFFGLLVYEARLWAPAGFDGERYAEQAFALELAYARKLEGRAIAERSVAEMRRVGSFTDAQARDWLARMTQAFPDVAADDRLVGLNQADGQVRFLHNGQPTADWQDPLFARLFFGIWLSPQTSAPALRNALLGLPAR